jgi:hypothetical protein
VSGRWRRPAVVSGWSWLLVSACAWGPAVVAEQCSRVNALHCDRWYNSEMLRCCSHLLSGWLPGAGRRERSCPARMGSWRRRRGGPGPNCATPRQTGVQLAVVLLQWYCSGTAVCTALRSGTAALCVLAGSRACFA